MNKTLKIALITLSAIMVTIGLIGFGITAFVSWVWGGIRFTPEAAMEAVSLGSSKRERIEADGCFFYYETSDGKDDWICNVTPVRKNGVGMWYASPNPRKYSVTVGETGEDAGCFISVEGEECYYNFYIPPVSGYDSATIPDFINKGYDSVAVDGVEIPVFKHSYFITQTDIREFEINGIKLVANK